MSASLPDRRATGKGDGGWRRAATGFEGTGTEPACCHPYPSRMDAGVKPDGEGSDAARDTRPTRPGSPDPLDLLRDQIDRVAEAYRRMPHSKFTRRLEPYGDRASAGRWLADQLATLAQGVEQCDRLEVPVWHRVPTLGVFALGDQIAVVGRELVAAFRAVPDPARTLVWTPGDGRVPADKALAAVLESTTALRRAL